MSIVRISKTENYSVIANQPINDKSLSWAARGMLTYLLSKPNDWQMSMVDLEKQSPAGEKATRTLVKELETAGYVVRERHQTEQGKFIWITTVYETQQKTIPPSPTDGSPTDGQRLHILSTELPNTERADEDVKTSSRRRTRKGKPLDTRIEHPAIVGYRELSHLNVPIAWRGDVVDTVGDDPVKIQRWLELVKSWVGHVTWNKGNIPGMLDAFRNGGLKNGKGYSQENQRLPKGV